MIATANLRRNVAIEFGMWRSVRNGGAAGLVTRGNARCFAHPGAMRS